MSIRLISAVFESECLKPTERLVLLALADHANDDGECWPSNSRLCLRTGLSERAVRGALRSLEDLGFISSHIGAGQRGVNLYRLHLPSRMSLTPEQGRHPAADAPGRKCPPAADALPPRQEMPPTPAADAPKPSGTIIEPLKEEEGGGGGGAHTHANAWEEAQTRAKEAAQIANPEGLPWNAKMLLIAVRHAVGWKEGKVPLYWRPTSAEAHCWQWFDTLGLSADQILAVASESRIGHPAPPDGPRALDKGMKQLAAALAQPPLSPAPFPVQTGRQRKGGSSMASVAARRRAEGQMLAAGNRPGTMRDVTPGNDPPGGVV